MGFYETISTYYDEVFPAKKQELDCITALLPADSRLLDIGCGNGNKTAILSNAAAQTVGIDADPTMIRQAASLHPGANTQYRVADMATIAEAFPPGSFSAAVCLGNTLTHLPGLSALNVCLGQIASVLADNGVFVLQILNYGRILDKRIDTLPLIETAQVRFERRYAWLDDGMHFRTVLTVKETGERFENDIILTPFRSGEMENALEKSGLTVTTRLGNYAGTPYVPEESFHLIIAARRVG